MLRGHRNVTAGWCIVLALASASPVLADDAPSASGTLILGARLDTEPVAGPDGIDVFTFGGASRSRQVVVGIAFVLVAGLIFTTMTDGDARGVCGPGCVPLPPAVPPASGGATHH